MNRLVLVAIALVGLSFVACGNPEIVVPDPLEVVYLPLSGAIDVEGDAEVKVFFSGQVDPDSISAESVFLESAPLGADGCSADWTAVERAASVSADDPAVVQLGQASDSLTLATCYRLTCTVAVRGVELGALTDLARTDRPGIGAEAVFSTRAP